MKANRKIGLNLFYGATLALMVYFIILLTRMIYNHFALMGFVNTHDIPMDYPPYYWIFTSLSTAVLITGIVSLIYLIKFIKNVKEEKVFDARNQYLLRRIVFFLLLFSGFVLLQRIVSFHSVGVIITYPTGRDMSLTATIVISSIVLYFSLFISALTYIFSIGVNLQKEKDLTI